VGQNWVITTCITSYKILLKWVENALSDNFMSLKCFSNEFPMVPLLPSHLAEPPPSFSYFLSFIFLFNLVFKTLNPHILSRFSLRFLVFLRILRLFLEFSPSFSLFFLLNVGVRVSLRALRLISWAPEVNDHVNL